MSEVSGLVVSDVGLWVVGEGIDLSHNEGVELEVGDEGLGLEVKSEGDLVDELDGELVVGIDVELEHEWVVSSEEGGLVEVNEVWIDIVDVKFDGVLGVCSVVGSHIWEDGWD